MKTLEELLIQMVDMDKRLTRIECERAKKQWEKQMYVS